MLNRYDKPADPRPGATRWATMPDPLDALPESEKFCTGFRAELDKMLATFQECAQGKHRGPFTIDTRHWIAICFESFAQREAFREAMHLTHHGEQYWAAKNFLGSLDLLQNNTGRRAHVFTPRPNPFAQKIEVPAKVLTENAVKYSKLRAEAKKTAAKLQAYTDDRTWIALCFDTSKEMAAARKKLGLPDGKFVHVEDMLAAIQNTYGITLNIPLAPFALRAEARPDKALNALVG